MSDLVIPNTNPELRLLVVTAWAPEQPGGEITTVVDDHPIVGWVTEEGCHCAYPLAPDWEPHAVSALSMQEWGVLDERKDTVVVYECGLMGSREHAIEEMQRLTTIALADRLKARAGRRAKP